jgi:hypothetical protein
MWKYSDENKINNIDNIDLNDESYIRIIKDYNNYYVTNDGKIYSTKSKRFIKLRTDSAGYKMIALYDGIRKADLLVHRIVAIQFIENPENKPVVNHINKNKSDNNVDNLEWATHSENMIHANKK